MFAAEQSGGLRVDAAERFALGVENIPFALISAAFGIVVIVFLPPIYFHDHPGACPRDPYQNRVSFQ